MDYKQVTIFTTHEGIEPLTGRLYRAGVTGVEIEDEQDFNEFLTENRRCWDYVDDALRKKMAGETKVKIYLPQGETLPAALETVRAELDALRAEDTDKRFGRLELAFADAPETDWANNWKQYFKPMLVGDVLIRPAWETVPENLRGHVTFSINPGMSFGTGTHETTRLCVLAAQQRVRPGARVLDLGCGSGILAIISLLLGAKEAAAVDIDPVARDTVAENARLNAIAPARLRMQVGDVLGDARLRASLGGGYDVVFANIVADVIIALAPLVPPLLAPGGVFITSGIIENRRDETAAALQQAGFAIVGEQSEKGWHCLLCEAGE